MNIMQSNFALLMANSNVPGRIIGSQAQTPTFDFCVRAKFRTQAVFPHISFRRILVQRTRMPVDSGIYNSSLCPDDVKRCKIHIILWRDFTVTFLAEGNVAKVNPYTKENWNNAPSTLRKF